MAESVINRFLTANEQHGQLENRLRRVHVDEVNRLQEQIRTLQEELRQKNRQIDLLLQRDPLRNDLIYRLNQKHLFIGMFYNHPTNHLSTSRIEYIPFSNGTNLNLIAPNISFYQKDLFIWTGWKCTKAAHEPAVYANYLSMCRQFKELRPDGNIRCLRWYYAGENPEEPDMELRDLRGFIFKTYLCVRNLSRESNIAAIKEFFGEKFLESR